MRPGPSLIPVLVVASTLAIVGCGGSSDGDANPATSSAPTSASSPGVAGGATYTTSDFAVPLSVDVPSALRSPPDPATDHLLSWESAAQPDEKVRFLAPVEVYRPGSATPDAVPADYVAYVKALAKASAVVSDVSETTVDGVPATLMTMTRTVDADHPADYLDGVFGCPAVGADRGEGCFGPQDDLSLRMAVVDSDQTALVMWARVRSDRPDEAFVAMFERMIGTVDFR